MDERDEQALKSHDAFERYAARFLAGATKTAYFIPAGESPLRHVRLAVIYLYIPPTFVMVMLGPIFWYVLCGIAVIWIYRAL